MLKIIFRRVVYGIGIMTLSLLAMLTIAMLTATQYQSTAKKLIEVHVNSVLYWHSGNLPKEVTRKGQYCTHGKCILITLEYAWYGAPHVWFSTSSNDWVPRMYPGVEAAWRIREVVAVGSQDNTYKHLDPEMFMVLTASKTHEQSSTESYAPQSGDMPRDALIVHIREGADWPFDSFALDCPDAGVMTGFYSKRCSEPSETSTQGTAFSVIPPKPFWKS
ncbi:MAG: hypothetical protein NUW00_03150 [Candidatus Kaiserbacteria bacterium]|nr:hypothetical protein [Candidatus Kaiserbacteria bacterium]